MAEERRLRSVLSATQSEPTDADLGRYEQYQYVKAITDVFITNLMTTYVIDAIVVLIVILVVILIVTLREVKGTAVLCRMKCSDSWRGNILQHLTYT
jgi:hypothetical protein